MKTKQVIVVRKDLKMRRGKEISQCAHASLGVFSQRFQRGDCLAEVDEVRLDLTKAEHEWFNSSFKKICVYVNSEQELIDVYMKAKLAELPCILIEDSGLTEFKGVKTKTCCAIGPAYDDVIDEITGNLTLY